MTNPLERQNAILRAALSRAARNDDELDGILEHDLHVAPETISASTLQERIARIVTDAEAKNLGATLFDASWRLSARNNLSNDDGHDKGLVDGSPFISPGEAPGNNPALPATIKALHAALGATLTLDAWTARRAQIERQVCLIGRRDPDGVKPLGTGFLVAPSIVMTNWHVLEFLLAGFLDDPSRITFRFDFFTPEAAGRICTLAPAPGWFLASNPEPTAERVTATTLDYVLVRLSEAPGEDRFSAGLRGKVDIPPALDRKKHRLTVNEPLCIVQHPLGDPLKSTFAVHAVVDPSPPRRVLYKVNTRTSSSGSPCFNRNWQLVALHRDSAAQRAVNEGIPIDVIRMDLPPALREEIMDAR